MAVLLTQRTAHLSAHAGQISFPGGASRRTTPTRSAAALRETEEEVGLPRDRVSVIGRLDTYVTGTGFEITPIVGIVAPPVTLAIDPFEVAEAFEVPLAFILDRRNHQRIERESARAAAGLFRAALRGPQHLGRDRRDPGQSCRGAGGVIEPCSRVFCTIVLPLVLPTALYLVWLWVARGALERGGATRALGHAALGCGWQRPASLLLAGCAVCRDRRLRHRRNRHLCAAALGKRPDRAGPYRAGRARRDQDSRRSPGCEEPADRGRCSRRWRRPGSRRGLSAAACAMRCSAGRSPISTSPPRPAPRKSSPRSPTAGIKAVPTGIAHGTVTAVNRCLPPRHFEITTLRRDVETDGRHARVAFDADWARMRRDATLRSTRSISTRTAHCTTRSAASPISRPAACALSASRQRGSPRMCCGSCAITAF